MAIAPSSAACRSRWTICVLDRIGMEPERGEHLGLDVRAEVAVGPHRPGDLAGPDLVDRGGQPRSSALDLERPAGELEPEGRRLGVDRVRATHHHGLRLRPGAADDRRGSARSQSARSRSPAARSWSASPRVDDVAARQPEVQVATLRADRFGDLADEGDDVVIGGLLDLGDPLDVDGRRASPSPRVRRPGSGPGPPELGPPPARRAASPRTWPPRSRSRPSRPACSGGSSRCPRYGGGQSRRTADVVASLDAVEGDGVSRPLGPSPGRLEVRAATDDREDPPTGRDDVAIRADGACRRAGRSRRRPRPRPGRRSRRRARGRPDSRHSPARSRPSLPGRRADGRRRAQGPGQPPASSPRERRQ